MQYFGGLPAWSSHNKGDILRKHIDFISWYYQISPKVANDYMTLLAKEVKRGLQLLVFLIIELYFTIYNFYTVLNDCSFTQR